MARAIVSERNILVKRFARELGEYCADTDGADGVEDGSAEADAFVFRPFMRSKQKDDNSRRR